MRKTYHVLWHNRDNRLCSLSFTNGRQADRWALRMRKYQGIMAWVEAN
jgi:hypothetical protein